RGDIDLESSPQSRKILLECINKGAAVLIDMSGVSYIDSSGIASLVEALQKSRQGKCYFALVSVSEDALRVINLARLDKIFPIHITIEDGLKAAGS
ncbi:MAG: STAS domain-containing protein, partial [Rhodospirillales bacterium]